MTRMAICYENLAGVAQKMGNHDSMHEYARQAVQLNKELGLQVDPWLRKAAGL